MPRKTLVPRSSTTTIRFFMVIVRSYFRRHFRSVMAQHTERLRQVQGPLVVYLNHSSWWDPMLCMLLARTLLPGRSHYGAIDAAALKRYPILGRLGLFPVEAATTRGAAEFLRVSEAILRAGGVVWVTPQGRFADVREDALKFKAGLAVLAKRVPEATLLPLAVEYTFWDERLPEALMRIGEAALVSRECSIDRIVEQLESALRETMVELQGMSLKRDAKPFVVVLDGGRGTGGVYALWRKVKAIAGGAKADIDHTPRD